MIICSCRVITDHDINRVVTEFRANNPHKIITPGLVFKALGQHPKCGTCIPSIIKIIHKDKLSAENGDTKPAAYSKA